MATPRVVEAALALRPADVGRRSTCLVLHDEGDESACWTHATLESLGNARTWRISADALAASQRIEFRLGGQRPSLRLRLSDGRILDSADVCGVLNRITSVPWAAVREAVEGDRDYAAGEWHALFSSWLASLGCRVMNPATPLGLSGTLRSPFEWAHLAGSVLLPGATARMDSLGLAADRDELEVAHTVIVLDEDTFAATPPPAVQAGCVRLARRAGQPLLGVRFTREWAFVDASPWPDLHLGGHSFVRALHRALTQPEEG